VINPKEKEIVAYHEAAMRWVAESRAHGITEIFATRSARISSSMRRAVSSLYSR
jgi:hypothetical protein